ncbi:hypothetical protein [Pandoraea fibrosis]|uniref:EPTP domain-containing protein n=1 Tax=Pandoraea fibrosis TaxID=1891094 RepID=A0A5E4TLL9_9BURK|nr:hypothetical protein [Pandoraea fibrosis]VVD88441.1 hypothetical protein PFI31113_01469 [Pandoraea fibrosis]
MVVKTDAIPYLTRVETLPTSAARAAEIFTRNGTTWLAVAQMSRDVPGEAPYMNGGDSNVDALLFRRDQNAFVLAETLPLSGGEDVEHFVLNGREFLACVGIRTGSGPYDLNTEAVLYERRGNTWAEHQRFEVFAGKQWRYFEIEGRHFLALAQGVTVEGVVARHPSQSCVFEWDGERFQPFQVTGGAWGYNWTHFEHAGEHYLAYADHVSGSRIFHWRDGRFVTWQIFDEPGGRAFHTFEADGARWLVYANLLRHTSLYRFDDTQFVHVQTLHDAGGRELCEIAGVQGTQTRYLLLVCFITGTPQQPDPVQRSKLLRWRADGFECVEEIDTSGATDAAVFDEAGQRYVVVTNSLSPEVRFRIDSVVYRFNG